MFLFVQQKNCLWLWLQHCLQLKKKYYHTVTWLKFEQNILNECGMPYIWYTHTFINSYWIVNAVKLSLKDKFKQSWNTSIQNSPKTFFSLILQGSIEIWKKYLEILDRKYLYDLFKLRTRNHKLPIECGWWQGIDRNRRLCKLCQKQEIGYEFHYILECPYFKCKRKLLIKQKYIQNPNMKQLNMLMTSKNRKELTSRC